MKNYQVLEVLDKEFNDKVEWYMDHDYSTGSIISVFVKDAEKEVDEILRLIIDVDKENDSMDLSICTNGIRVDMFKSVEKVYDLNKLRNFVKDYISLYNCIINLSDNKKLCPTAYENIMHICREESVNDIISHDGDMLHLIRNGVNFKINTILNSQKIGRVARLVNDPNHLTIRTFENIPVKSTNERGLDELLAHLKRSNIPYIEIERTVSIVINEHIAIHIVSRKKYHIYLENGGEIIKINSMSEYSLFPFIDSLAIIQPSFIPYALMMKVMKKYLIQVSIMETDVAFTRTRGAFNSYIPYNLSIGYEDISTRFIESMKVVKHLLV